MDVRTEIGPLATAKIRDELEEQVSESVRRGARLLTGGKRRPGRGFYFDPTVLADPPADSPAARDELFGPVATIFRARDVSDAISIANESRYGLGASAWTEDEVEARRVATDPDAGMLF